MPAQWSRRALLASAGAAVLAGCTADGDGTETDATPSTATPTRTATARSSTDRRTSTTPTPDPPPTPDSVDADWPMPARDPGRSNHVPDAPGPTAPVAELWRATAEADRSAPVVADGIVYVGGADGVVRALDARTGTERWRQSVGTVAGAPRVLEGHVFVPADGAVVALDRDGAEAWRTRTTDRTDLLVASHGVYALVGGRSPTVVALARADGSERWRRDLREPWTPNLFAGEDALFVSTGSNGRRPWQLDPADGAVVGDAPRAGHDFAGERFALDGVVYAVDAFFGSVVARPVREGATGWSRGVDAVGRVTLAGGADRVYCVADAGGSPGLSALSRADGAVAWRSDATTAVTDRPAVADDCVVVPVEGGLRGVDPADGSTRWTVAGLGAPPRFVVVDDLVYATVSGTVRAFRPRR